MKTNKSIVVKLFIAVSIMTLVLSCDDNFFALNTHEIDWDTDSDIVVNTCFVDIDILGADDVYVYDTLLLVKTNNPSGQIKIFSTNTLSLIGSFCTKGRTKNEFLNPRNNSKQFYLNSRDELIFPIINNRYEIKEFNVTQSIRNKSTVVNESVGCIDLLKGYNLILDNDINKIFEYRNPHWDKLVKGKFNTPRYYIKNSKENIERELSVFPNVMNYDEGVDPLFCYFGQIYRHPEKNFIVQPFQYMDYILYFDLDNERYFAVHRVGSPTFDDNADPSKASGFGGASLTSKYIFILYLFGPFTKIEGSTIHLFDWEGNRLAGFKLHENVFRIAFDEKHSTLYGLGYVSNDKSSDEALFSYDLSDIMFSLEK